MSEERELTPSEMFLKYDYPETKDLCKYFLTLITTVFVISLTFSEKVINFGTQDYLRWLLIFSWCSFLIAIIFCGLGLLFITIAAGEAVYHKTRNRNRTVRAYKMIIIAGGLFISGLIILIGSTIITHII